MSSQASTRSKDLYKVFKGLDSVLRGVLVQVTKTSSEPIKLVTKEFSNFNDSCPKSVLESIPSPSQIINKGSTVASNASAFFKASQDRKSYQKNSEEPPISPENQRSSFDVEESVLNPDVRSLDLLNVNLSDIEAVKKAAFVKINPTPKPEIKRPSEKTLPKHEFIPKNAPKVKLASNSKERKVPSSRVGRVASFSALGMGLGLGAIAEASKRAMGLSSKSEFKGIIDDSILLSDANAERVVDTLCRVRGAALKIGQILSIQDDAFMSPRLQAIFERVRQSADYMPKWQMEKMMTQELGKNWRDKYDDFNDKPFAAASIGQVHSARLHDGRLVAVKIQYPGVADSIKSDINNLLTLLNVSNILPEGLFLKDVIDHMEIELTEECDYLREAECCRKMKEKLADDPGYYVPDVIDSLCTSSVLTIEFLEGLTIDECLNHSDQEERNFIAESILKLLMSELFVHRYMQTDPNWANFLYNPKTKQLGLIDFGATREYSTKFVNDYFEIIDAAAHSGDRQAILDYSIKVGFLTGYESKLMNDAHIDSVMILGECFRQSTPYDFGNQSITSRIQDKSIIMIKNRLCPPPPEVYSLHRKMSGSFLLASKLKAKVDCHPVWQNIRNQFLEIKANQ